jgi:Icc-related predicted phosphoesterase
VLVACGHIHDSWGGREVVGETVVVTAGPGGFVVSVEMTL